MWRGKDRRKKQKEKIVYIIPDDWLDEKLREIGVWTIKGIGTIVGIYFIKSLIALHIFDLKDMDQVGKIVR